MIVAPSGMLEGGWSPYYLWQLAEHYGEARVVFIGYQAADTVGRELLEAPGNVAAVTVSALMWGEQADDPAAEGYDFHEKAIDVPTSWLRQVNGMSGHAAANTLLGFARTSAADRIELVHGSVAAGEALREYLADNTDVSIQLAETNTPITFESADTKVAWSGSLNAGEGDSTLTELRQRQQQLQRGLDALNDQIERYARTEGSDK